MVSTIRIARSRIDVQFNEVLIILATEKAEDFDELRFVVERLGQRRVGYPPVKVFDADALEAIAAYIERNLPRNIQIERLAAEIGISPDHFGRRFKATLGVSPYAFVTRLRMAWARQLIITTDTQVEDIADRVGVPNVNYFRKQFRKIYGVTPSYLRISTKSSNTKLDPGARNSI